ncbi:stabilizer of axonemal microtubules 2 [Thunnus albacares]|uniref:stabilizer of axonemal microtubules 2 n=1 Tax=Thunnus albacares TaxID=8236 RepID=UPI001CF6A097|nr:stabilizer of axonemal microtubules 2 [Thunnus albacares]
MQPKTMKQQNTQHGNNHQATSMRRHSGSHRAQTRASMATEYQERFLPPSCHKAVITTSTQIDPYHPLKGTGADMTTYVRSYFVAQKWIKNPQKIQVPQPPVQPKGHRRCNSAPHNPARFVANQNASQVEDYTSVYKNDFQAWKADRRQPYKVNHNLKVNQGLVITDDASKEGRSQKNSVPVAGNSPQVQKPLPFESITSYRSDYVTHPVQPRVTRAKPVYQTNRGLPLERPVSCRTKQAWDTNPDPFDEASEFLQQFKRWSLGTKFHTQGRAKESSPPADHSGFLSTTHADYTAHRCQHTRPVLPCPQTCERSKEPFQAMTTQKEDYKVWDTPRCLSTDHKELNCPKKTTFSVPQSASHAETSKTTPKLVNLRPKMEPNRICNANCSTTEKPQCPAENGALAGFKCISSGNEESRMYWATSLDNSGGVTCEDCEEPSPAHQIISCMVSSRS